MEEAGGSAGIHLLEAFKKLGRRVSCFRPCTDLRFSEFFTLHALHCIWKEQQEKEGGSSLPGVTISALSRISRHSMSAVSQIVTVLEEKGLVERTAAQTDRRKVYVRLSGEGERQLEEAGRSVSLFWNEVAGRMGEADTACLIRLLEKLDLVLQETEAARAEHSAAE